MSFIIRNIMCHIELFIRLSIIKIKQLSSQFVLQSICNVKQNVIYCNKSNILYIVLYKWMLGVSIRTM